MSDPGLALASVVAIIVLVQSGMHVAIALGATSYLVVWLLRDNLDVAGSLFGLAAFEGIASYSFGVIPLFIFMGLVVGATGIGRDTFEVAAHLFRRSRSGLGIATIFANAVFAAVQGTSIASASVFTKVAVPELLRLGYAPRFAAGIVAGSSVLGMLIPPSLLLILYGIIAEVSIGRLFTAGILPGLLLTTLFILYVIGATAMRPAIAGHGPSREANGENVAGNLPSHLSAGQISARSAPILILVLVVLGGIYGGVFTPTEAGGVGALAALVIAALLGRLTFARLWEVMVETGKVTASISFLLICAHFYANMIAMSGLPNELGNWLRDSGLGSGWLLVIYFTIIVMLGTILDSASILLIMVPLVLPLMQAFGVDLIWLGVTTIIAVEVGLLTPPLGVAAFVIRSNLDDDRIGLGDIFRGAAPFAIVMLVLLLACAAFPELVTALV